MYREGDSYIGEKKALLSQIFAMSTTSGWKSVAQMSGQGRRWESGENVPGHSIATFMASVPRFNSYQVILPNGEFCPAMSSNV